MLGWIQAGLSALGLLQGERNRNDSIETQKNTWDREDTSLTRRMIDAKNAGINPLLVAGQGAQSSSPTIQKGGEIDPNDFLAPLQAKLLQSQIGVTNAQKLATLADAEYKQYETESLIDSGMLKTDTGLVKNLKELKKQSKPITSDKSKTISEYKNGVKIEPPKFSNIKENASRLWNYFTRK